MSSDPRITTFVYILIAVVFVAVVAYMIFYNRSVKSSKTDFINRGDMTPSNQSPDESSNKPGSGRPTA